jgi:predicted RecA/RadA family phage recombinase
MLSTPQQVPAVYAYSGFDGIDWYNSSATTAVTPGSVVQIAGTGGIIMYGIARQTIPPLTWGNLAVVGVFDLVLDGSSTFKVGDVVYWNGNLNVATSSGSYSADIIGLCVAATAGATDVSVRTWLTSSYLR